MASDNPDKPINPNGDNNKDFLALAFDSEVKRRVAESFAKGDNPHEIQRRHNISIFQFLEWREDPEFQEFVSKLVEAYLEAADNQLAEGASKALDSLAHIIEAGDFDQDKVNAAKAWLAYSHGNRGLAAKGDKAKLAKDSRNRRNRSKVVKSIARDLIGLNLPDSE